MLSMVANDPDIIGGRDPCPLDMSVLDLATFVCVHRAGRDQQAAPVASTLSQWFDRSIDPRDVEVSLRRMLGLGWVEPSGSGVRATIAGRRHARTHLTGVVRMLDQGTRMLDVALQMAMLRLAACELDGDHPLEDEDLNDGSL